MSIIVETGLGLTNSQCVASVADLTTYLSDRGYPAVGTVAAETGLVRGWSYIENKFRGKWLGEKIKPFPVELGGQALAWPRMHVFNEDNYELPWNLIPQILKDANCEAARLQASGVTLSTAPGVAVRRYLERAGDQQKEWEYAIPVVQGGSVEALDEIDRMLAIFLRTSASGSWGNVGVVRG